MYVATKGGERAIGAAHRLQELARTPRPGTSPLLIEQMIDQQWLSVSRVMCEGSVYDPNLAAMAILQAQGDLVEAVFLVRAFRTTLPRFGTTQPIDTTSMKVSRRISAAFKDLPGGQILGPTFDYSHRLLGDVASRASENSHNSDTAAQSVDRPGHADGKLPRILDVLNREGLVESAASSTDDERDARDARDARTVRDLTREPVTYPCERSLRLQALARGDEGFLLALGYSTQRGFGSTHPFAGEIRVGEVDVWIEVPEIGADIVIGSMEITECEMINQFTGNDSTPPQFTRGYGIGFGSCERRTMSMALVDRSMRAEELGEVFDTPSPAQDQEFVLSHVDAVEASGFVTHLKLPHYVDFQSELVLLRDLRLRWEKDRAVSVDSDADGIDSGDLAGEPVFLEATEEVSA